MPADAIPCSAINPFDINSTMWRMSSATSSMSVSIRELERAEQRLGFQSVVLNKDAQNFDDAPQQPRVDMARVHDWKFSSEQRYRDNHSRR